MEPLLRLAVYDRLSFGDSFMDAFLADWGAYLTGQIASGCWTSEDSSLHQRVRDKGSELAFLSPLIGKEVCLATDNSTFVAYLNNQGA